MSHHCVMHSQQKRWPQGVAAAWRRSSRHSVHTEFRAPARSSAWLLRAHGAGRGGRLSGRRAGGRPAGLGPTPAQHAPARSAAARQRPLSADPLPLPEAVELQAQGQRQVQQRQQPQQAVARAGPRVLGPEAGAAELRAGSGEPTVTAWARVPRVGLRATERAPFPPPGGSASDRAAHSRR